MGIGDNKMSKTREQEIEVPAVTHNGFSLIELLTLCALFGVVFIVGILGYQSYINNARAEVAQVNAQSVERWLISIQIARANGGEVVPIDCGADQTDRLTKCFGDLASEGKPFSKFKNPYQSNSDNNPIFAYVDNNASYIDDGDDCTTLKANLHVSSRNGANNSAPENWDGIILLQLLSNNDNLTLTSNRIRIGYCNAAETLSVITDNTSF